LENHLISTLIFTDDSVSSVSVEYSFYIPSLQLQLSGILPPIVSSFTVDYHDIIENNRNIHFFPPATIKLSPILSPVFKPKQRTHLPPNVTI